MRNAQQWSRRELLAGAAGTALAAAGGATGLFAQGGGARKAPPEGKSKPKMPLVDISVPDIAAFKPSGAPDEGYWKRLRGEFVLDPGITFFNNGAYGPTSRFVIEARRKYDLELGLDPRNNFRQGELGAVRRRLASFIGAGEDEVALTHATTDGVNIFAAGLDWKPGDEVVVKRHEHFGPVAAYEGLAKRYGVKIVQVETPAPPSQTGGAGQIVEAYEKAITPRTRVLFVSHVTYITGLRTPLKELAELAHRHGALISVDGVQALGAVGLDVKEAGIDHYAAGGQKWLLGGTGTGFTYVKRDVQGKIWPRNGFVEDESGRGASAQRYENTGQLNIPAYAGLAAGVELLQTIGAANVEARVHHLADRLKQGVAALPGVRLWTSPQPEFSAGLTTFGLGNAEPGEILRALEAEKIYARSVNEPDVQGVRVSTHVYNSPEEIDRLLAVVRKLAA
ncbi:MAG: aminotransferase class V-fold PLP-dependent enzyme [Acidobacteriota bacterium]|jgi:L-cysteine/cystine lyase|nr:aminotransferase class V-fold PLP-dependent enzyme [Acidobacteriota bacterium]